ncbi:alpha/beta fold hydrolase [Gilvimarinus xylanilyticus]|uniref:Alpha/beta hydrolase n=1 Tax=Gilvimarinus xylanilyticus TaxID=2944139 RepID=A0A9X2HYM1_9GAMM|nr:alpha/beta hydrolase [Gilvimarinus xylanilyticus]MCP8898876.1 alpha/beta hydrolase [Gilvimarinus xylanilyticus]
MSRARERQFEIDSLRFAAQQWGDESGQPVLALHGWLDNSASFAPLAPQLRGLNIIALDMAGHGQSCHRPGSAPYNIWEDVAEVLAIADRLGWDKFSIIGHSRGAIVAALTAAAFAERIDKMALIEGIFPEPVAAEKAPQQLAESIRKTRELAAKPLRLFPSVEAAIKARINGMFPLSEQSARLLTERGITAVEGGFQWSTDQRLLAPSSYKMTREQIHAFVAAISSPCRVILGDKGMSQSFPGYDQAVKSYKNLELCQLPGGHHLHMEQQSDQVAELINEFFT